MSDRLRDLAELSQPNAECDCGHSARRHFVFRYCGACGCSRVRAAEVEAEYARLVGAEVAHVLTADGEPKASTFKFGFQGFTYGNATITTSRYAPGKANWPQNDRSPFAIRGVLIRVVLEDAHARPLHDPEFHRAVDLSWGAERSRLREYLRSRIIPPPIAIEHAAALKHYLPLVRGRTFVENAYAASAANVLVAWSRSSMPLWSLPPTIDALPLVRVVESIPPHLLPPRVR